MQISFSQLIENNYFVEARFAHGNSFVQLPAEATALSIRTTYPVKLVNGRFIGYDISREIMPQ
jgi:hypothetical protein